MTKIRRRTQLVLGLGTLMLSLLPATQAHATITNSNLWFDNYAQSNCGSTSQCNLFFYETTWTTASGHGAPKPVGVIPDTDGTSSGCENYTAAYTDNYTSGSNWVAEWWVAAYNTGTYECDTDWRVSWGAPSS